LEIPFRPLPARSCEGTPRAAADVSTVLVSEPLGGALWEFREENPDGVEIARAIHCNVTGSI
jgi:hypothetical protein